MTFKNLHCHYFYYDYQLDQHFQRRQRTYYNDDEEDEKVMKERKRFNVQMRAMVQNEIQQKCDSIDDTSGLNNDRSPMTTKKIVIILFDCRFSYSTNT